MNIIFHADEPGFNDLIRSNSTTNKESLMVVNSIAELVSKLWERVQWIYLLDYTTQNNPGIPHENISRVQFIGLEWVQKPSFIPKENWTNFSSDISFIQQFKTFILKIFEQE
jgi:hypothetical protein